MRLAAAAILVLAVAGCACGPQAPVAPELFAVIPGPSGHVGAVVVRSDGAEQVLDQAYAAQRIHTDGSATSERLSKEDLDRAFGPTIGALPGRPASFFLYFLEGKDELTPGSRGEPQRESPRSRFPLASPFRSSGRRRSAES